MQKAKFVEGYGMGRGKKKIEAVSIVIAVNFFLIHTDYC